MKKSLAFVFICLTLVMIFTVTAAHAQPIDSQLRLVQIFYSSADVYLDDMPLFMDLAFTVGTDFVSLPPGTHRLAITAAGGALETTTTTEIEAAEGHQYTLLTMGEFETGVPNLLTIDETTTFAEHDPQGNSAIIVQNVPGAIPVDVWFVDELKIENLTFGGYGTASAPLGQFTARAVMAGDPNTILFESHYFAVPGTVSLAYLSGAFPDKINRTFFTTTNDNMVDYLAKHVAVEDSKLSTLYELIEIAGLGEALSADGQWTLFAPTNAAFEALPAGTLDALKSDPAALANILQYHLVEGRWGPYELTGEHTLTSVQGSSLETVFQPVEKPLSVNEIPTGLQHRVSNGVIYLIDSVLLPPGT